MAKNHKTRGTPDKGQQPRTPAAQPGQAHGGQDVASAADAPKEGAGNARETGEVFPEAHREPSGESGSGSQGSSSGSAGGRSGRGEGR